MRWIATIISNLAVGGGVAWLCLGSASVEAQPIGDRFAEGYQAGYVVGYEQGYEEFAASGQETVCVEREVTVYVEREVPTYIDREVTVNRTLELRDFESLEEMKIWLALDDTSEFVFFFAGANGKVATGERYDCDDYARQLQQRAVESGFYLSLTILDDKTRPHMVNLAVIEGAVYYIEPQTDEYWYHSDLD